MTKPVTAKGAGAEHKFVLPPIASVAAMDSDEFLDAAIPLLRRVILRQMKNAQTTPGKISTANTRVRDSGTLASLVQSLERLETLEATRQAKGMKKTKSKNGAELKERFVRRLDQLLAAEQKKSVSGESQSR